jgi:hypothetical protein
MFIIKNGSLARSVFLRLGGMILANFRILERIHLRNSPPVRRAGKY